MNSNYELMEKAKKNGIHLVAITTKDNLPKRVENGAYIINLQDDYHSNGTDNMGTHWVGLYVENEGAVYFDPFGFLAPANVELFLSKRFRTYHYNPQQIQDIDTGYCGIYVLCFLAYMIRNKTTLPLRLYNFRKRWSKNTKDNLRLLKRFISF